MLVRPLAAAIAYALLAILPSASPPAQAQEKTITVFAAASLKNVIDELGAAYNAKTGIKVVSSYAASSQLARQIEQGAPADVFLSADIEWMDYCERAKLTAAGTRVNLLGNKLVLVAPANSPLKDVAISGSLDLAKLAGNSRIATGDVRAVPVGLYAKAALEKLGLWKSVEAKMAMAENVRAALAFVAREEATLGIVYETDAKVEPKVKVVGVFPEDSHPPIVYPAALTVQAKPDASGFLAYLRSREAKAVFEKYGFTMLAQPSS